MTMQTGCLWLDQRNAKISEAIAYLKSQCILVSLNERDIPTFAWSRRENRGYVAQYRVSGRFGLFLAEDVIELADKIRDRAERRQAKLGRLAHV